MLERLFHIREAGSTPGREALGGLTTFLTMAYIVFVNPVFLVAAGMPREGAILATCLGAAFATLLMAFLANYPIALAPGMGMNAFFAFSLCAAVAWPAALGLVFWAGVIFLVLTLSGAREMIVRGVPPVLKLSAAVGIGFFIAFIGLGQGGVIAGEPHTLVTLGDLGSVPALMTLAGLGVTLLLVAMKVPTAIFWGMAFTAFLGLVSGVLPLPSTWLAMPRVDLPGSRIELVSALRHPQAIPLLLVLVFFAVFDNLGTLMGIAHQGGFLRNGELPRMGRVLAADAAGSLAGALFGTSTVTSYIESGTGVGVGARTGLASVVTGLLFLATLFAVPLASVVGGGIVWQGKPYNPVTAPALVIVGTLMVRAVKEIAWEDMTEAVPAFFTALLMPLTYNISHGLAAGVVLYVLMKAGARRWREIHPLMHVLAAAFVAGYGYPTIRRLMGGG